MPAAESREILIPHELTRGPVTAVRRMLVQSSIAALKAFGFYDRYCTLIGPASLSEISDQIGPGWLPIDLATAHYRACDALGLSSEQLEKIGAHGGARLAAALLGGAKNGDAEAKVSPWLAMDAFWRMGRRVCQGSSSQYVKLGPTRLQIENIGNTLYGIDYFRLAYLAFLRRAFSTLGVRVTEVKVMSYSVNNATLDTRVSWL